MSTNWFKKSNNDQFIQKVKVILKKHPFTKEIANYYHIPLDDIDKSLRIEVCDLHGEFAKGNGKVIRLDQKLLDDDFFKDNFHFVIHEFFHWVKRRSEQLFYFNDPEEIQSFVLQMVWLFISKKNEDEVSSEIFPIIKTHFKDPNRANKVFGEMLQKAITLYKIYQQSGTFSM
jgi:hypothetical protein